MSDSTPEPEAPERVNDAGLPLAREPTLADVRGEAASGRVIAVGCTVLVAILVAGFWLLRVGILD